MTTPDKAVSELRFRHTTDENGNDVYTLWPERTYDDGWVVGWCPELGRTMIVHPANVLDGTANAR